MDKQRQCPNCGGYKVTSQISSNPLKPSEVINYLSPEMRTWSRRNSIIVNILVIFLITSATFGILAANIPQLVETVARTVLALCIVFIIYATIHTNTSEEFKSKTKKRKEEIDVENNRRPKTYFYHCQICGKDWSWEVHQPYPYPPGSITPNPQLIRDGEQRLAEEERQRQITAMAYYEQQRRRRENK